MGAGHKNGRKIGDLSDRGNWCSIRRQQLTLKHIVQENARRNGLKIAVLAISTLFAAYQISESLPG
jgi:hypothetical protein